MEMKVDFSGYKVGDKVWSMAYGWGTVTSIEPNAMYEINFVDGNDNCRSCTYDGRMCERHTFPTVFPNEFTIPEEAYKKPLPDLAVDTPIIVWKIAGCEEKRHFARWDRNGQVVCFFYGKTSWTADDDDTASWDNWRLPAEDEK